MPNFKGGKNFKKGKKKSNQFQDKRQLIKKDIVKGEEYAQVINPKGNGRFELKCCDSGRSRMGLICGKMRKRVWVNRSDLVLISLWTDMTNDDKCSIVHKYSEDESKRLQREGELPENFTLNLDDFNEEIDDRYFIPMSTDEDSESESESEEEEELSSIKDIDIDDI